MMICILRNDTGFTLLRAATATGLTLALVVILLRPEMQTVAGVPVLAIAGEYHVIYLLHALAFSALFSAWCWALVPAFDAATAPLYAFLIALTLGITGELLQTTIAGRVGSIAHAAANVAGIVAAWAAYGQVCRRVTQTHRHWIKTA